MDVECLRAEFQVLVPGYASVGCDVHPLEISGGVPGLEYAAAREVGEIHLSGSAVVVLAGLYAFQAA